MGAFSKHRDFIRSHPRFSKPETGYTYDPSTGKHYDANVRKDRQRLIRNYAKGKKSLYIVANTQNNPSPRTLAQAKRLGGGRGFIGGYTRKSGKKDTDTSFPVTSLKKAKELKKRFGQESIMKISSKSKRKPTFIY